jgi:predicted RNase H-like HicB family nuclease
MNRSYTAVITYEDGWHVAEVPALAGCSTQARTYLEAVHRIDEALQGVVALYKEEGRSLPLENILKKLEAKTSAPRTHRNGAESFSARFLDMKNSTPWGIGRSEIFSEPDHRILSFPRNSTIFTRLISVWAENLTL